MKRSSLLAIGFLTLLVAVPAPARALRVSASAWGSLRDANADGTFESVSFPTAILANRYDNGIVDRGAFEISLAGLVPAGMVVSEAILRLTGISSTLNNPGLDLYGYAGDGTITVTDATLGSFLYSRPGPWVVGGSGQTYTFDVTSLLNDPGVLAAGHAGFVVRLSSESVAAGGYRNVQLRDPGSSGTASPWLDLTVVPIPEPSTAVLMATGLGLIASRRARARASRPAPRIPPGD